MSMFGQCHQSVKAEMDTERVSSLNGWLYSKAIISWSVVMEGRDSLFSSEMTKTLCPRRGAV